MRNQIFAIINTREINSTLKYKLRYTINNARVKTAASSAVRVSCDSCTPVVVTTLRAFSGKLPYFFISCCDCWRWHCSRQRPTRIGRASWSRATGHNTVKSIFTAPQCRLKRQPERHNKDHSPTCSYGHV